MGKQEVINAISDNGHCPPGSFVNINASSVMGVHGLCPKCPSVIDTKSVPHLSSEEKSSYLMCDDISVPLASKKMISPHEIFLDDDGTIHKIDNIKGAKDMKFWTDDFWKEKQREINPRAKLSQIQVLADSHGQPSASPGTSIPDEGDNFKKCMLAHFKEEKDEDKLMKEIITYRAGDLQCIHNLKGVDCDKGYSGVFASLPHEILKTEVTSMTRDDYDLSVRNMLIQSRDTESKQCNNKVSDTTQSLLKTPEYNIDLLVILAAVYIVGNFILKLSGR